MSSIQQYWYVVKQPDNTCQVKAFDRQQKTSKHEQWGSFANENDAIAKKIGLIRAGKCNPQ